MERCDYIYGVGMSDPELSDTTQKSLATEELKRQIATEVNVLGRLMEGTLPFKQGGWLRRWVVGPMRLSSTAIIMESPAHPPRYTRAWLQRPITSKLEDSTIELCTDVVEVNGLARTDHSKQTARLGRVAAQYNADSGLKLGQHPYGTSQGETLARIQELTAYVNMIADENKENQLRRAAPCETGYSFT